MANKNIIIIRFLLFLLIVSTFSCRNVVKKVSKKITEPFVEESSELVVKKGGKEFAEEASERIAKKMDWGDIIKILKKENPILEQNLTRLSRTQKQKLVDVIAIDDEFFSALKSSRTVMDEYFVFTKDAPKLLDNVDFFRLFAKSDYNSRLLGQPNLFSEIIAKEEKGLIRLFDKKTNHLIADYSDGIMRFSNIDRIIPANNLVRGELMPNSLYKMKGRSGLEYSFFADILGRVFKVEAQNVSPEELLSNVLRRNAFIDLDSEWNLAYRKLKQSSAGNDIIATVIFRYADDGLTPQYAHIDASVLGKTKVSKTFSNINASAKNEAVVKRFAKSNEILLEKQNTLLREMSEDIELAKLIRSDPKNIQRWLNTRNHVDKRLIILTPKGQFPKNARVYAGNIYYFNPHLNSALKARLQRGNNIVDLRGMKQLTYEDLIKLDKLYPEGVPFTKQGFPDFSNVAAKGNNGRPIIMNIKELSGDSKKDVAAAEELFQKMGYKWEPNYTWHHIENTTTLMRVPRDIHQLVDHTGGMSMSRIKE